MVRAEGELMENLRLTHTAIEQQLVMLRGQVKVRGARNQTFGKYADCSGSQQSLVCLFDMPRCVEPCLMQSAIQALKRESAYF